MISENEVDEASVMAHEPKESGSAPSLEKSSVTGAQFQSVVLQIDVELNRFKAGDRSSAWASATQNRLAPLKGEISRLELDGGISKDDLEYLFRILFHIMPSDLSVVDKVFRAKFYEHLLSIKPDSPAALRQAIRAREQCGDIAAAKNHLEKLVKRSDDPLFKIKLNNAKQYLARRRRLMDRLLENRRLLAKLPACHAQGRVASKQDQLTILADYVDNRPVDLAPFLLRAGTEAEQFEFSEMLVLRKAIKGELLEKYLVDKQFISAFDLRDFIQNKTVCVVANSAALLEGEYGEFIDKHDVVIRFNSFRIEPVHTGEKTDIHVSIHMHNHNRDQVVPVRILLGNVGAPWVKAIRAMRPDDQCLVGDESLKYPLYAQDLCDERIPNGAPTSGFNILKLLRLFSNFEECHLVGFDGYQKDAFRTEEGMKHEHAKIHRSDVEMEWIESVCEILEPNVRRLIPLETGAAGENA